MTTTVVGVFEAEAAAQSAVNQLRDAGVPMDNISVIARPSSELVNEQGEPITLSDDHMTAGEGATAGAIWGGLVGLAAMAIPGIGPLVTSNIFAAALTGAVAGAATGGIAGALIDAASVPEEHARIYEEHIRRGGTLVSAQVADGMASQARSILNSAGARDFDWDDPNTFLFGEDDTAEENYAESSKVGTIGGGAAGALTGAAMGAAGGPVGAVIGGVAGAVVGGSVGAVGDTLGEEAADSALGDGDTAYANRDAAYDRAPTLMTGADADLNRLDNVGYVAQGMTQEYADDAALTHAEQDYADSSKLGTASGGTVGAITGAAMGAAGGPVGAVVGGVAGAVVGSAVGAAGDTVGEHATENYDATTTPNYINQTGGTPMSNENLGDKVRDAFTDDQGDDTIRTADKAYDDSSKAGTLGGAAAGAVTGAVVGSAGGPVGTMIGAVAGAVAGGSAGAIGDTIGKEAETETGAFSPANKAQYDRAGDKVENAARDAGNAVERGVNADLDNDGDVGRRH